MDYKMGKLENKFHGIFHLQASSSWMFLIAGKNMIMCPFGLLVGAAALVKSERLLEEGTFVTFMFLMMFVMAMSTVLFLGAMFKNQTFLLVWTLASGAGYIVGFGITCVQLKNNFSSATRNMLAIFFWFLELIFVNMIIFCQPEIKGDFQTLQVL